MSNTMTCQCGAKLKVRPNTHGRGITCPKCSRRMIVPAPGAAPLSRPAGVQSAGTQSAGWSGKKPKTNTVPTTYIFAGLAFAAIAIIGGAILVAALVFLNNNGNAGNSGVAIAHSNESPIDEPGANGVDPFDDRQTAMANPFDTTSSTDSAEVDASEEDASDTEMDADEDSDVDALDDPGEDSPKLELVDLIDKVMPSVVLIDVKSDDGDSFGSGFVVDRSGLIVTNYHVIDGAKSAKVTFKDGTSFKLSGYLNAEAKYDLGLLRIDPGKKELVPLKFTSTLSRQGEKVATFGSPAGFQFSTSQGVVSAHRDFKELSELAKERSGVDVFERKGYGTDSLWIQTTASISGGNSGGPLVDMRGRLVGVNTWSFTGGQNLNFASATANVKTFLKESKDMEEKPFSKLPQRSNRMVRGEGGTYEGGTLGASQRIIPLPDAKFEKSDESGITSVFNGHKDKVVDMAISPDGRYLCTTSKRGGTFVFDMATGKATLKIESPVQPVLRVAFSRQPQYLFTLRDGRLNESISIRHPQDGKIAREGVRILETIGEPPKALAVSGDARTIFATWRSGEALLWRLDALEESSTVFEMGSFLSRELKSPPSSAIFAYDGRHVMVGSESGLVSTFTGAGNRLGFVAAQKEHTGQVTALATDSGGKYLYSGGEDGRIYQWTKWQRGINWGKKEFGRKSSSGVRSEVIDMSVSNDAKPPLLGIARANGYVEVYSAFGGKKILDRKVHAGAVTSVRFSREGKYVISAGIDTKVKMVRLPGK